MEGGRAEVLYLILGGGMGDGKDKEKHQRNTGGTERGEEMCLVRARRERERDGGRMKGEK